MAERSSNSEQAASDLMLKPKQSKAGKDDPVWSILPSYYMYQSTFYGEQDPPEYVEASTTSSELDSRSNSHWSSEAHTAITTVSSSSQGHNSSHASSEQLALSSTSADSSQSGSLIVADELTTSWRETILDNVHELRNMTNSTNCYS